MKFLLFADCVFQYRTTRSVYVRSYPYDITRNLLLIECSIDFEGIRMKHKISCMTYAGDFHREMRDERADRGPRGERRAKSQPRNAKPTTASS